MRDVSIINQMNRYDAAKIRYDEMIKNWPQFETLLIDRCVRMAVNLWIVYFCSHRQERRKVKSRLREISFFLTPHIKAGFCPEGFGKANRTIVKLIPYPYEWSFAMARGIKILSEAKRRFIKEARFNR